MRGDVNYLGGFTASQFVQGNDGTVTSDRAALVTGATAPSW